MKNKIIRTVFILMAFTICVLCIVYWSIGINKELSEENIKIVEIPIREPSYDEPPMDEVEKLNQRPARGVIEVTEIPDIRKFEVPDEFSPIDCRLDEEIQRYTYSMAQAYNIDFEFLMAVMFNESAFDPNCVSRTNDYGLMQINKCNHKWLSEELGITDYLDPYQSILAGTYIFSGLFEKYGDDTNKVLMSYNMGDDSARRLWNQGIYESNYSRKISQTMAEYKERISDEG